MDAVKKSLGNHLTPPVYPVLAEDVQVGCRVTQNPLLGFCSTPTGQKATRTPLGSIWNHTAVTGKASSRVVRMVPDSIGKRTKKGVGRSTAVTWHGGLAKHRRKLKAGGFAASVTLGRNWKATLLYWECPWHSSCHLLQVE